MISKKSIINLLIGGIFLSPTFATDYQYFKRVQESAKAYRVECTSDQMRLVDIPNGEKAFYLDLKSNRNNFEMVMLVGFIAAGEAMKSGFEPDQIFIKVRVPLGGGFELLATTKKEELKRLMGGEINTTQFMRIIQYL